MSVEDLVPLIERNTGHSLADCRISPLSGGDINAAYHLQAPNVSWFIKVNRPALAYMFEAEAAGLRELAGLNAIRVPGVISSGHNAEYSYLVLEFLQLGEFSRDASRRFGEQLAALHQHTQPFFGWHTDNTIGSTRQSNARHQDWPKFWREQRLQKQLQLASANGFIGKLQRRGEILAERVGRFFDNYRPRPALLHGDLWGGNAAADRQGEPFIYDPACYYGDREADIAMTELFGGFDSAFYQAYQSSYPLDPGYQIRKTLYNLYHIINHLNLFGGGYLHQAETMIEHLLAET